MAGEVQVDAHLESRVFLAHKFGEYSLVEAAGFLIAFEKVKVENGLGLIFGHFPIYASPDHELL